MKKLFFCSILVLGTLQIYAQGTAKPVPLGIEGQYSNSLPSPDGSYILLSSVEKPGLFLYSKSTNQVTQISDNSASNFGYSWDDNGQYFYYIEQPEGVTKAYSNVMTYSIEKGEAYENQDDVSAVCLPSFTGLDEGAENQIVAFINFDDLQAYTIDLITREQKNITQDDSKQYYYPVLSDDKTKMAVHSGSDIYIYTLDGSEAPYAIGQGIATDWSSDGRYVLGFLDESEDGHELDGSELYLFDTKSHSVVQITDTKDIIEVYPSFYGDNQILFSDAANSQILTITLNPQN